jgi:creatinine amidohydrolase
MPARFWLDLTTEEFRTRDMSRAIAILPVAAVEQHGPHLPVGVDTYINQGYLDRTMDLVPEDLDVLVLPVQAVGKSNEHLAFPGTITFTAETAIRAWTEIGESVYRTGCRKLVFANSHGGNVAIVDIVARELRVRHDMLAVNAAWSRLGYPPGTFSDTEARYGIHGGDAETSLMLAFRPDAVRMDKARNFDSRMMEMDRRFKYLRATQPVGFGWMSQDLNPAGAMGEAAEARLDKGEAAAEFGAQAIVALLREIDGFELNP